MALCQFRPIFTHAIQCTALGSNIRTVLARRIECHPAQMLSHIVYPFRYNMVGCDRSACCVASDCGLGTCHISVENGGPNALTRPWLVPPDIVRSSTDWLIYQCVRGADHTVPAGSGGFMTGGFQDFVEYVQNPQTTFTPTGPFRMSNPT